MVKFSTLHKTNSFTAPRSKKTLRGKKFFSLILFLIVSMVSPLTNSLEKEIIAVLPFRIESSRPSDHLVTGLQKMLTDRLAGRGYPVVSTEAVNRKTLNFESYDNQENLGTLGKELNTDWIILGSVTETGKKTNLDIRAVNVINPARNFSIFMVEGRIDDSSDAMNRCAEGIDNRISGVTLIENIEVEGNLRIGDDAILTLIDSRKGEPFDQDLMDRDLRSIYKMGYFNDVEISTEDGKSGKIVTFKVAEKPSITRIKFEGNKRKKTDKLLEEIGIKIFSVLDRNEIQQSINRLRDFYIKAGHYNIQISEKITELPDNEVSLTYEIDEGEKIYINKIEFIGNEAFSDKQLKKNIATREKGLLSWFTSSGLLDTQKLEYDVHMLTTFYHDNGYIRVKVGEPEVTYDPEEGLTLTTKIEEGNQYIVDNIRFEGELILPREDLLKYITMEKGKPFSGKILQGDIETIKSLYADEGYAYIDISPIPVEKDQENIVDVLLKIDRGKKIRYERININGNKRTRDKVIRRELKIVEGDYFSGENLNRSIENLKRTGFFEETDGLKYNTRPGSTEDLMIVDINVEERNAGSINGGVGYGGYEKAFVMAQISHSNFRGLGQKIQAQASLSSRTTQFNTSFTEPWLFDTRLSTSASLFKWETDYTNYTRDNAGASIGIGFPLEKGDYTRGTISYAIDSSEVNEVSPWSSLIIRDMEGKYLTSAITVGISHDSRDQPWNTRRGSRNVISFQYAGGILGGDTYFNKYQASSTWFLPFKWKTVLVASGAVGYVKQRSGGKLPLYEKFRVGGDTSVRGYDWGTISPLDPVTLDEIGGNKMWTYSLEYRIPLSKTEGVVAYTFFDMGNAFDKTGDWNKGAGRSVGAGIRWLSPMGPINFGYGYKLDERPNEESGGQFLINMGTF